jgi:indolepyruvate ferredoxin oxidoreductase
MTIVTSGKAYTDVRQALDELGIDEDAANALGLAIYKVGMVWPLEAERMSEALEGVEEVVVVEERRAVIEPQLKEIAYNWPAGWRPNIVGKRDETMRVLLPEAGELSPEIVARAIGARLERLGFSLHNEHRLRSLERRRSKARRQTPVAGRIPHFCSGCPHARSTRVPEGDVAMAGIGCHSLRVWMPKGQTMILPQMGGEGASWLGIAPFARRTHVFQNLGDGTFMHSGSLAIRAAVAAGSNITFRVFCNQATGMTGGQPIEGEPEVADIVRLIAAEGVARIAVVSDEKKAYAPEVTRAPGVSIHHRNEYDSVQRELRNVSGVSAIVYDQICATEKRRLVKRGKVPAPTIRPMINVRVCDGCGDCVEASNCAAILPLDTELGRKRRIDQSSCNTDLSCLEGLCPSFVTVEGGKLQRALAAETDDSDLPQPTHKDRHADIVVVGIGGTGVMTIGAVTGMAAHLEGMASSVLDNTGMARKGGAVSSHVRIAPGRTEILASRIPDGNATLMLVCDLIGAAAPATLAKIERGRTHIVANANVVPTFNQRLDPDAAFEAEPIRQRILDAAGEDRCEFIEATAIAERMLGDSIYANMLLFGYAFQKGLVPLPAEAVEEAIRLNGADVPMNRRAFALGRRMAIDPRAVPAVVDGWNGHGEPLDTMIDRYAAFLADYQDDNYARRFREVMAKARAAERAVCGKRDEFTRAVAHSLFRLMAIKDEYEIGRLYTDGEFDRAVRKQFSGPYKLRYHMAPMFLARHDRATGRVAKWTFGAWFRPVLAALAAMRRLRGTPLDIFGWSAERRIERALIADYEALIEELTSGLGPDKYDLAVELAGLHAGIRGYGAVKAASIDRIRQRENELVTAYRSFQELAA